MNKQLKVWLTLTDGQDGSYSGHIHPTKEEALAELDRSEEELEEGSFYEDGILQETTLNVIEDEEGNLTLGKSFYFTTD